MTLGIPSSPSRGCFPIYTGHAYPTPPLTPSTPAVSSPLRLSTTASQYHADLDDFSLPPPMSPANFGLEPSTLSAEESARLALEAERHVWKPVLTVEEKNERSEWLSQGRGRKGLRIVIVTENFLPKVDGVTRTLARLLEHLAKEGHQCMILGPGSGMDSYAGHPLVGTLGVPLVLYPGLKLNFLRPRFLTSIKQFQPDVVHFVDPIWLGAQTLMAMELGWAGEQWVTEEGPAIGSGIKGAIVASYHTNLATYATLFGLPWLEPILWKFQCWLYSKTVLTLCPSPSTKQMLHSNNFAQVNLWPRGVDLSQFSPSKRSRELRAEWGVGDAPRVEAPIYHLEPIEEEPDKEKERIMMFGERDIGLHFRGRKSSLPLTPPLSPSVGPGDVGDMDGGRIDEVISLLPPNTFSGPGQAEAGHTQSLPKKVVLLFVGRISWEKNIHLLLAAYALLPPLLPAGQMPKLVFVGDGPARAELEGICAKKGYDATFMGQRVGEDLARCFASADVFAFPSFTETFGQVVLEALASGLPVIGLDAEGTRDLVSHGQTGLLLPYPAGTTSWPTALKSTRSGTFASSAQTYATLLARVTTDHGLRAQMAQSGCTEGTKGFTWWDAMERCVDGYRESMRISRGAGPSAREEDGSRIGRVNRVLSRGLAHRDSKRPDTRETIWHLKTILKFAIMVGIIYYAYQRHSAQTLASKLAA